MWRSWLCTLDPPPRRRHNPLQVCAADPVLCKGVSTRQLQVVSSGSGLPVIDLSQVGGLGAQACGAPTSAGCC